jgi:large subunit ribosomal protein L37Ae
MAGSTKRLGARYGRRIRKKLDAIETAQKTAYKCPYCNYPSVKRIAAGIWTCKKCTTTFTGRAYSISKTKSGEEMSGPEGALAQITVEEPKEPVVEETPAIQEEPVAGKQMEEEIPAE